MLSHKSQRTVSDGEQSKTAMPPHTIYVIFVINLNLLSSSPDGERTFYITPDPLQRHSEHCLNLSQFAKNSSRLLSPNTALIFLAGSHTLNTEIFIKNFSTFSMLTSFISGGTHTCYCEPRIQDQAYFMYTND